MKSKLKNIWRKYNIYIKLIISITFLYLLFSKFFDIQTIIEIKEFNYLLLLLFIPLTLSSLLIRAVRWKYITKSYKKVTLKDAIKLYLIGIYYASITPGKLGEIVRGLYYSKKYKISKKNGIASVIYDRLFDIVTTTSLVAAYLITPNIFLMIILAFIISLILLYISLHYLRNIKKIKFLEDVTLPRFKRKTIILALLSITVWIIFGLVAKLITLTMGFSIPYSYMLFTVCLAVATTIIPISFNGWGLREGVYVALLTSYMSSSLSLILSILFVLTTTYFLATFGLILETFLAKRI
jgi:uncharacterized membrane protein YbhN (UPF0104 family)